MNWSEIPLKTLRENPADAEMESHRLLVRSGCIKKLAPGIFSYSFLFLRSLRKLENILREELTKVCSHEILMPMVQPAELWQQSGRWSKMTELLKFKNKNNQNFCLGATHEEVIIDFVQKDLESYRDFPINFYQIQTKYRDEIRPRYGLMRCREFIMKDAYSFDIGREQALQSYRKMEQAYRAIFKRLGVEFVVVHAHSGTIGGELSSEFQVLAEHGMDQVLLCQSCGYSANLEVVPLVKSVQKAWTKKPMEKLATPGLKTIGDLSQTLKIPTSQLVKSFFVKFQDSQGIWKEAILLLPGHREVNLIKTRNVLQATSDVEPLSDEQLFKLTGARAGSCGPVGLKIPVVMDQALKTLDGFIVGANQDGYHFKNVVPHRDFGQGSQVYDGVDISQAVDGDSCPECGRSLSLKQGIEVGHIFYLGTRYSEPMGLQFLDEKGQPKNVEMGCFGIGVTRSLQAVVEQSHDTDGICWPLGVSPFDIHVCLLDPEDQRLISWLSDYQRDLEERGFHLFVDDRKKSPGIKFKDADLLGFPLRVVLGKRGFENNELELVVRKSKEKTRTSLDQALCQTLSLMENLS